MQPFAYSCFSLAHCCSVPIHEASYCIYSILKSGIQKDPILLKIEKIMKIAIALIIAFVALVPSLVFSSLAGIVLSIGGKKYLEYAPAVKLKEEHFKKEWTILNFNVGFLPGRLAQELTVGKIEIGVEERQEQVGDFLVEQCKETDLILLEEAIDFGFMEKLIEKVRRSAEPVWVYFRIGDPLSIGICSGLSIISKFPIDAIQVEPLPFSDWFFRRFFIQFHLPDGSLIVHTHLIAGDQDSIRLQQVRTIGGKTEKGSSGYLIGDLNFSDDLSDFSELFSRKIERVDTNPTLKWPLPRESRPDFVGVFGEKVKKPKVEIMDKIVLSDHFPLKIQTKKYI